MARARAAAARRAEPQRARLGRMAQQMRSAGVPAADLPRVLPAAAALPPAPRGPGPSLQPAGSGQPPALLSPQSRAGARRALLSRPCLWARSRTPLTGCSRGGAGDVGPSAGRKGPEGPGAAPGRRGRAAERLRGLQGDVDDLRALQQVARLPPPREAVTRLPGFPSVLARACGARLLPPRDPAESRPAGRRPVRHPAAHPPLCRRRRRRPDATPAAA